MSPIPKPIGYLQPTTTADHLPMRLQKYLAHRGIASRREIEAWIEQGAVIVNGQVATLGMKVDPMRDHVIVNGKKVKPGKPLKQPLTFVVHKPKGFLCSHKDPHHTQTVFQLVAPAYRKEKLICAGRLDKDSEGLVVLTTDGQLAQYIMHPSHEVVKRYEVKLDRLLDPQDLSGLRQGVWDEGDFLKPFKVIPDKSGPTRHLEIHLNEGKKREIRRLLKAFGYEIERLKRVQIGRYKMEIPVGASCQLRPADIEKLTQSTA